MAHEASTLLLTGRPLRIEEVENTAHGRLQVRVAPEALQRLADRRRALEREAAAGNVIYGVNTGFGSLSTQRISDADLQQLQQNLVRSHAAGVGELLDDATVRAAMLLLAASLARGLSGVRPVVVERVVELLNAGVVPCVPSVGSVGASGDLAPLAHIALVLLGEGEARLDGRTLPGAEALAKAGVSPLTLQAKEGLALLNGTHLMTAQAVLAHAQADRVFTAALDAAAMAIDACRGTDAFLDDRVHKARCQPGQREVARQLALRLEGSQIVPSHRTDDPRVQDPYSLRCAPQALGAALDLLRWSRGVVERELGAVTDNPLVFESRGESGRLVVSAGNFHGMPLALAMDAAAMALATVANIAERRVQQMLAGAESTSPLPAQLSPQPGLHSGMMLAQYTAAACCNELAGLAHPASSFNIPTCAGMEDFNSFGPRACAKALRAVELTRQVVAIELLVAAQALEHRRPLRSGRRVEQAYETVRRVVAPLEADRPLAPDIAAIANLIETNAFHCGAISESASFPPTRPAE